jgi:hypothetical protein
LLSNIYSFLSKVATRGVDQYGDSYTGHFWSGKNEERTCSDWSTSSSAGDSDDSKGSVGIFQEADPGWHFYNHVCSEAFPIVCTQIPGRSRSPLATTRSILRPRAIARSFILMRVEPTSLRFSSAFRSHFQSDVIMFLLLCPVLPSGLS